MDKYNNEFITRNKLVELKNIFLDYSKYYYDYKTKTMYRIKFNNKIEKVNEFDEKYKKIYELNNIYYGGRPPCFSIKW